MITGVLQARISSRRLEGKVLAELFGQPMILRQVERLKRSKHIDRLVVATSTDLSDDSLARTCENAELDCYRGSLEDVLDRMLQAAGQTEHIVRLTADCPLADPEIIDRVISEHVSSGNDYTSNTLVRTFPDGLDVEVVRHAALAIAAREARQPYEREHVTPFLYKHPDRFKLGNVTSEIDRSELRWTVDEQVDLKLVRAIYAALYPSNPRFTTLDVLHLLTSRPELAQLNNHLSTTRILDRSLSQALE